MQPTNLGHGDHLALLLLDRGFRHLGAQFPQLSNYPWWTARRVGSGHLSDQIAHFFGD
jgi:hypothetical protein